MDELTIRTGEVWVELATIISAANSDLVITGTRGRRGITKMLLGSVAEEIFRLSPVPVLTVGPAAPTAPARPKLCSILHPIDFSIHSTRAAEYALRLAREFRSCITWLHIVQHPTPEPSSREYLTRFFSGRLAELLPPEASDWCQPQYRVEFGEPAENIPTVAREVKVDLIVMGIWGAGALARATTQVGNTAYRVVCNAQAPVLSIRGPARRCQTGLERTSELSTAETTPDNVLAFSLHCSRTERATIFRARAMPRRDFGPSRCSWCLSLRLHIVEAGKNSGFPTPLPLDGKTAGLRRARESRARNAERGDAIAIYGIIRMWPLSYMPPLKGCRDYAPEDTGSTESYGNGCWQARIYRDSDCG